jgi:hypothetical protein
MRTNVFEKIFDKLEKPKVVSKCRSRNCPGFDPSILRHSGILEAADEAVLNFEHKKGVRVERKRFLPLLSLPQRVTKRCRLSWLTKSALVYEPNCAGGGGLRGLSH